MNNFLAAALCGGLQLMQSMQLFVLITSVVIHFEADLMSMSLEFQFYEHTSATLWHNTAT